MQGREAARHQGVTAPGPSALGTVAGCEATTSSLALWPFGELAARSKLGREWAMRLAGLEESELRDPDVLVDQARANRLAATVSDHFGPGAAIAAAETIEPGHFNLLEILARSAPTVADGLELACQFLPLIHRGGGLCHQRSAHASVVRWQPGDGAAVHPGYLELLFAVGLTGIRRETGVDVTPRRVWFSHPAPSDTALYGKVFGDGLRFDMPENLFELDGADAALPLVRANPATVEAALEAVGARDGMTAATRPRS